MIDLRCHILNGTPCGPATFAESVEMGRQLSAAGVTTAVATPRWAAGSSTPPLPFDECRQKLARLQSALGDLLALQLGFVLPFSAQLPARVDQYGAQLALGGQRHLLILLPALNIPAEAEEVWGALMQRGYAIILAQPGCNPALRRNPDRLARWVALGLKLQFNAASIAGTYGREVQHFALACLRRYEANTIVASNAKSAGAALNSLSQAHAALQQKLGERQSHRIIRETPAAIIAAAALAKDERSGPPPRRLTSLLRTLKPGRAYDSAA